MKKLLLSVFSIALAIGMDAADLKVNVDLSHDLWWNAPETPTVKFSLADSLSRANESKIRFFVTPDTDENSDIFSEERVINIPKNDSINLTFTLPISQPGFYKCFIEDDGNVIHRFNIGYEPTSCISLPDSQPDFDTFWQRALNELAAVDGEYKVVLDKKQSGKKRKAYDVEMKSWGGETIRGKLYVPVADGKYPALIYYNGYGAQPWDFDVDGRDDLIEFVTGVRGQMYNQPYNTYGDWIRYNLDKPDSYYYKGAFMDAVRFIDFISQYEKTDTDRIFAEGGSQGGALTLAAASLDDRLAAICPYIPFLSDYKDYFKIVNWPAAPVMEEAKLKGLDDDTLYRNLSYFDIKNLARRIKCPVMMGIGLQDPTCPPHTNMSSYNLITSQKQLIIYPTCGHTVDYSDWNPRRDKFLQDK